MSYISKLVFLLSGLVSVPVLRLLGGRHGHPVILFGSGFHRFVGNSKYLYLTMHRSEAFTCLWVAHSRVEQQSLIARGCPVVRYGSPAHYRAGAQARAFIITHNVTDVFPFKPKGVTVLQTWHGTPIKPIGWDSHVEQQWIERKRKTGRRLPYEDWDTVLISSRYALRCLVSAMRLPESTFRLLGQPQNVVWRQRDHEPDDTVTWPSGPAEHGNLSTILYAPTFRSDYSPLEVIDWDHVLTALQQTLPGTIVGMRLHPHDERSKNMFEDLMSRHSRVLTNMTDVDDIMEILPATDVLMTDYSSVIFDYLWTENPIIILTPDYHRYCQEVGELYMDPRDLPSVVNCESTGELMDVLCNLPVVDRDERKQAARRYHSDYPDPPDWSNIVTGLIHRAE